MLKRLVGGLFFQYCHTHLDECDWYSDGLLREHWEGCRKRGYQLLRDGKLIPTDPKPLFDDEDNMPGCTVYAHTAILTTVPWRVIKLGYASKNVEQLIRNRRAAYDAKRLATTPGDLALEKEYLRLWRSIVAWGNEWFHPTVELVEWIRLTYVEVVPNFDVIADEAINDYLDKQGDPP
jgi:hypothetical protein